MTLGIARKEMWHSDRERKARTTRMFRGFTIHSFRVNLALIR